MFAHFFWSNSVEGRAKHWASWDTLCFPKEEGGVGFSSLHDVSKALFCKLWWNFMTKATLWSSFICQKYYKKLNAMVVPWRNGSHVWRKMIQCLGALYFVTPPELYCDESVHNVYDVLIDGSWDVERLLEILPRDLAQHVIENIKPFLIHHDLDRAVWALKPKGRFTIKSAWEYTRRRKDPNVVYNHIWVRGLIFKIAFFV
ncbi:uncharacterized protein [Nicotiana tomentosiformis]|uniref:uncharacterized protein n=1 Tax=Nicotiana tomentosiformis TaxID=4098 RepID=UPI00388C64B1